MDDSAKYLIHADITADGVVERSDVVGAVFGQTEGLLGEELDLRDLQRSSKVGRIDVQIDSEAGRSAGEITIASSLDKVETAILAASLETIDRVGPCRAEVRVDEIEDVRAAKRRAVVERAKELLTEAFDEEVIDSRQIREEVRASVRVAEISEYRGLPAGPRVADSDAVIVVEGRADVLTLLGYGIKNAVAVEGTDVPDAVADLSAERTVTAFLDGDRGGELILRELRQVGDVDYVAFAPEGRSVEDLARHEVMSALREKVPVAELAPEHLPAGGAADGLPDEPADGPPRENGAAGDAAAADGAEAGEGAADPADGDGPADADGDGPEAVDGDAAPRSLRDHVREVVEGETGTVRLLDADLAVTAEADAADAFDALDGAETPPYALVLDGELDQRVLDVAAQRGVDHVVARGTGEFVKTPVDVRVRTAEQVLERTAAG